MNTNLETKYEKIEAKIDKNDINTTELLAMFKELSANIKETVHKGLGKQSDKIEDITIIFDKKLEKSNENLLNKLQKTKRVPTALGVCTRQQSQQNSGSKSATMDESGDDNFNDDANFDKGNDGANKQLDKENLITEHDINE
jgi:hypothetical protein